MCIAPYLYCSVFLCGGLPGGAPLLFPCDKHIVPLPMFFSTKGIILFKAAASNALDKAFIKEIGLLDVHWEGSFFGLSRGTMCTSSKLLGMIPEIIIALKRWVIMGYSAGSERYTSIG